MGEKNFLSTLAARLAQALYAEARFEEAESFARTSRETSADEDIVSQVIWRGALGKTLTRGGRVDDGEALAREAVTRAEATDALNMRADAAMDLGEVLRLAGRATEAASAFRRAKELYERKGNVVSARKVGSQLATVT